MSKIQNQKKKSNRLLLVLAIIVVVLIVILVIGKKQGWVGQSDIVKVSTSKAETTTITESVTANGKIQPEVEVKISSDVSGEIRELYVREGDSVKVGQLLARIDPELYESA